MATDFTPPRPTDRSMRPYVRSVNHIKPDQLGNVNVAEGTPGNGDTYIYNSTTNLFEFGHRPSKVDEFTITSDTVDTFALTFTPVVDSWVVSLSWRWESARFTIAGNILTVTDPTDSFRGIADSGPRTLTVQYDYLDSVTPAPPPTATFPQDASAGEQATSSPTMSFADPPTAGSSVLLAYRAKFGGPIAAITGLGATWTAISTYGDFAVWVGVGCNGVDTLVTMTSDHTFWTGMIEVTTPLTPVGAEVVNSTNGNLLALTADGPGVGISINRAGIGLGNTPVAASWTQIADGGGGSATLRAAVIATSEGEALDVHTNGTDDWDRAILAQVLYA